MLLNNLNILNTAISTFRLKQSFRVLSSAVRVRFAPSPTGHIHLGGLRSALYNYIFAKQHAGQFILRIEDTDQSRTVPGSADEIENVLNWAGLKPDESPLLGGKFGPYVQSQRADLYKQHAQQLVESGHAYRCFCSPIRLDLLRRHQARNREKIRYDGKCKHLTPEEVEENLKSCNNKFAIRFALLPGQQQFNDLIFGTVTNNLVEALESDPIILKSDGFPTYHFANVIDDHAMQISHVLRGSEWISSTAKHLQLYKAMGWAEPKFAHFPLITMTDGTKMSKRNDDSRVKSWIEAGYTPNALLNFLTQSGGGVPKSKQDSMELWTLGELVNGFKFEQVTCHPGSVDLNRLRSYSISDMQRTWNEQPDELMRQFYKLLETNNIEVDIEDSLARVIISQLVGRIVTLKDLLSQDYIYLWQTPTLTWSKQEYLDKGIDLKSIVASILRLSESQDLTSLGKEEFLVKLRSIAQEHNVEYAKLMKLLRRLLTNSERGLPIYEIAACLGESRFKAYLRSGLKYIS